MQGDHGVYSQHLHGLQTLNYIAGTAWAVAETHGG
jgi:hypothetical protein